MLTESHWQVQNTAPGAQKEASSCWRIREGFSEKVVFEMDRAGKDEDESGCYHKAGSTTQGPEVGMSRAGAQVSKASPLDRSTGSVDETVISQVAFLFFIVHHLLTINCVPGSVNKSHDNICYALSMCQVLF